MSKSAVRSGSRNMDLGKPAPRNSRTAADISRESHVRKKWMFSNHMLYRIFVQNCVIWTSKNNCQMLIFGEASIWTVQRLWVVILYFCPIGRLTYMYIVHFYDMELSIWTDPKLFKCIVQMDDIYLSNRTHHHLDSPRLQL